MPWERPSVFVGSSSEGRRVADHIQVLLDDDCEVEIWSQGAFGLGESSLASLVGALNRFDFAILVVTADDVVTIRGETHDAPRDNVLFELGLFMGALGPARTFIVTNRDHPPKLPSDLAGVTRAEFAQHSSGNLEAALGAPCTRIREAITRLGGRDLSQARHLVHAAGILEDSGTTLERLIGLIARSRKVELDIILKQFSSALDPEQARDMQRDLDDLSTVLRNTSEHPPNPPEVTRRARALAKDLANFQSNPEGVHYIGTTLVACDALFDEVGVTGEPVQLVHELMRELDDDTRKDEGLFDPILSVEKIARLRRAVATLTRSE